jgi:hypothetical protein
MAAKQQRADLQKQKEKKEKIILAALVGVMVIVGALELPKMLKKSGPPAVAATQTTPTSPGVSTPGVTTPGGTAAPTGTAVTGPVTAGSLPNANSYAPSGGQLSEFSLFNGKDPFGNVATNSSGTTAMPTTPTTTTSAKPPKTYVAAKIAVNGTVQAVLLKGTFPSTSSAFALVSATAKQIEIAVNGGSFSSGQGKVAIAKGRSVVLMNTVDSIRYVIKYIAPLTSEEALALLSTTTTSGTSTTTGSSTATTTAGTTTR